MDTDRQARPGRASASTSDVTVIIPAVVEPDVHRTIESVLAQTVLPSRIIVAVNNAGGDDATRRSAEAVGSELVEVRDLGQITGRKAGALNRVLETLPREGFVMVMDADTTIAPTFLERALRDLDDPAIAATGAVFSAETASSYLELCQRLEWIRYAQEIRRTGRTWVLSGTAAVIKWPALESVRERFGRWYDERSITEDGRLSVDLKVCGWRLTSPLECAATTEVMPTWSLLVKQRTRWFLGAMQTVRRAPLTKASAPYLGQQLMLLLSVALLWTLLILTAASVLAGTAQLSLFWSAIGLVFAVERTVTIPGEPLRHRLFAAAVIPEMVYAVVLQWALLRALAQFITRSTGEWTHVSREKVA